MTTYMPKTRPQPAAANTGALPKELNDALAAAESLLGERDRIYAVLVRTHTLIPELLARRADAQSKLAAAEVSGTDATSTHDERLRIEAERLTTVSRRQGAIQALLDGETGLTERRDVLVAEKDQYARKATEAFRVKYDAVIRAFQEVSAEGDALASALRFPVEMPLPVTVSGGRRETVSGIGIPECDPIKVERVPGTDLQPVTIDPVAQRVGTTLDRLGTAIDFANGLRASIRMQDQMRMRETARGWNPAGTYIVLRPFMCHTDNLPFQPGVLIDSSLVGLVSLQRSLAGKSIRLIDGETRAEAA